jgi:hypothetical protein
MLHTSVNLVVPPKEVVSAAVKLAVEITENSPEAVQSSRRALWDVADSPGVEDAFKKHVRSPISARVYSGVNIKVSLNVCHSRQCLLKNPIGRPRVFHSGADDVLQHARLLVLTGAFLLAETKAGVEVSSEALKYRVPVA